MKRLRLVFVLLSALLWLPLLFLVALTLRSVEQEEAGRYKAVADRIFDEMERELSAVLRREDERPASEYADIGAEVPAETLAGTGAPFVIGYFERRHRTGLLHTAFRGGDASALAEQLLASSKLALAAEPARKPPTSSMSASGSSVGQSPGSTLELKRKGEPLAKDYDVLSALNRAVRSREESKKLVPKQARGNQYLSPAADSTRAKNNDQPSQVEPWGDEPVKPGSFVAERVGDRYLILIRDAEQHSGVVKQGLVIGLPELLAWLSARVLERGELRDAAHVAPLELNRRDVSSLDWAQTDRGYQHRFGEPFSSISALLTLDTLPELEASAASYWLSAALLLLGALALYAGYRMIAAVVEYAERRSNFVSAITHELKTPLTAIRMYGEMLRDDMVPEPQKRGRYYRIITAESERLTRLIDNVLELARIERGQRSVSLAMGDVTAVVRETLEVLEPHASELGFRLELEAATDLPSVAFDRDALAQVLFNLIDNALKYSSQAEQRTVTIRCERERGGVLIRVVDRGPGVDPGQLQKIWQPFYRGERELTRQHKGTGIGLSLVRGLVERMGGQVSGRNLNPGFEVSVSLGT